MSKHRDLQIFMLKLNKMRNFQPLEVVGRGSETQLQVGGNKCSIFLISTDYFDINDKCTFFLTL